MTPNIPDLAEKAIAHIEYGRLGAVTTLCLIQMDNGHEVVGQSHCANPASFDEEIGRVEALKVAMGKVEELIAFRLKEARSVSGIKAMAKLFDAAAVPPGGLPLYRSHKLVRAGRIKRKVPGGAVQLILEGGHKVEVDGQYMVRHNPQVGGYYVVYADGYQSFSPAEAFESGYVRVTE